MLAEHDLQRAPYFRRTRGHIPSSQLFISMHSAALGAGRGKLATFSPDFLPMTAHSQGGAGGDGRDRTDDLMLAKQLLSQLSYVP